MPRAKFSTFGVRTMPREPSASLQFVAGAPCPVPGDLFVLTQESRIRILTIRFWGGHQLTLTMAPGTRSRNLGRRRKRDSREADGAKIWG